MANYMNLDYRQFTNDSDVLECKGIFYLSSSFRLYCSNRILSDGIWTGLLLNLVHSHTQTIGCLLEQNLDTLIPI